MNERQSKYPWDEWTSTQAWRVQWLVSFDCLPQSFQSQIHIEAKRRGLKATTLVLHGKLPGDKYETAYVFFQFYEQYAPLKPNLEALQAVRQLRAAL